MRKMFVSCVASAMLFGVFSGCGSAVPSCDDKAVQDVLTTIIQDQLDSMQIARKDDDNMTYKYSTFMTEKVEEQTKKVVCKAQVAITDKRNNGVLSEQFIHYSARMTDDKQSVYVELLQPLSFGGFGFDDE